MVIRIGEEVHIKEGLKIERYDAKGNVLVAYLGDPYNKTSGELGDEPYDLVEAEKEIQRRNFPECKENETEKGKGIGKIEWLNSLEKAFISEESLSSLEQKGLDLNQIKNKEQVEPPLQTEELEGIEEGIKEAEIKAGRKGDNSFKKCLEKYIEWGLSIIPIEPQGKRPLGPWQEYQTRRATTEEVSEWFDDGQPKNIGIVCGEVSGNLLVLDFDNEGRFADWGGEWDEKHSDGSLYQLTPVVTTGRGFHVYFRSKEKIPTRKLDSIDIRGEGSYIVAPPSIHPSSKQYKFINPDIDKILEINDLSEVGIELPIRLFSAPTDSKEETTKQIAQLIEPYWKVHSRHSLALSISGFLAKLGWASPMVKDLIQATSKGAADEELKDRLRAVDDTFTKHQANMSVKGYAELKDILPQTNLEKLEELAKSVKVPPLIRKIDDIRLSKEPAFLRKRSVAQKVIDSMKEEGKFLKTSGNELFYFRSTAISLDSEECKAILNRRFGLNPTEREGKFVLAELVTETLTDGEKTEIHQLVHWDRDKDCLYIDAGNGKVLRLNGISIDTLSNGDDSVYFARKAWQLPFDPDFENPLTPREYLTDDLSFEVGELVALSSEQQKIVARLFVLGLFFPEELSVKPILCVTGDKGSGKSVFLRRIVKFLYGNGDVVNLGEKDDFHASLSANHFLPLDDIEKESTPRWLIPELKRVATGEEISLRKLYSTNTEIRFTPHCFLAFTSINSPIEDSAFADRLIILRLSPRKQYSPEFMMFGKLKKDRNRIWAGLLSELNKLIPKVKQTPTDTEFRLADWASLAERIEGKETMDGIIKGLTGFQNEALFENSPIPSILEEWRGDGRGNWLTTAELYEKWKVIGEANKLWFPYNSPRALGMHLESIKNNLNQAYGITSKVGSHRKRLYLFPNDG